MKSWRVISLLICGVVQLVSCADTWGRVGPYCTTAVPSTATPIKWSAWTEKPADLTNTPTVVPCGVWIELDENIFNLRGLEILGKVTVSTSVDIVLQTQYILNRGQLEVGSPAAAHPRMFNVRLFGSTALSFDGTSQGGSSTINGGVKAFVTYGGTTLLYGLDVHIPVYTRLASTALIGASSITVLGSVDTLWRVGNRIAISTSSHMKESEDVQITGLSPTTVNGAAATIINIATGLRFDHKVTPVTVNDKGTPFTFTRTAEVALLTRNIRIEGQQGDGQTNIGGHFMIMQTLASQDIEGVEFFYMGQSGTIGRYPVHLHFLGDKTGPTGNIVKRCAIWNSNQRCVVVHATNDVLIDNNVAYLTSGHCYMLEDGLEKNNVFNANLGIQTEAAKQLIITADGENDDKASTFWIVAPNNVWTNNIAAGARDSGFWFDPKATIRGLSKSLPGATGFDNRKIGVKLFSGNEAHAAPAGLRTFPDGWAPETTSYFTGFISWANGAGWVSRGANQNMVIENSVFANNINTGVSWARARRMVLRNSIVIGTITTDSFGFCPTNPEQLVGIKLPTYAFNVVVNLVKDPNSLDNVRFFNFPAPSAVCSRQSQALEVGKHTFALENTVDYWLTATNINNIYFDPTVIKRVILISPQFRLKGFMGPIALADRDGAITGTAGSFLLTTGLPGTSDCTPKPEWNAVQCNACYESVIITYTERTTQKTDLRIQSSTGFSATIQGNQQFGTNPRKIIYGYNLRPGAYTLTVVAAGTNTPVPKAIKPLDVKVLIPDTRKLCGASFTFKVA